MIASRTLVVRLQLFKLKVSEQRTPGSSPQALRGCLGSPPPRPPLRTWGGEGERVPSKCLGRAMDTPAGGPALPPQQIVSSQSTPAGGPSRGREAQASAREAAPPAPIPDGLGGASARGPATLRGTCGDSAVPADTASGVGREPSPGWGRAGLPGLLRLSRLGLPQSRPRLPAGSVRTGQGAIFSESCSPSWTDRTS